MKEQWTGISTGISHKITAYDFGNFIECEVSPDICPLVWDRLSIIENLDDRRYCKYCDKTVYKVDSIELFDRLQEQNKCMVISKRVFENINGKIDKERYLLLQNRLKLSELFLIVEHYDYETITNQDKTFKEKLQDIVTKIFTQDEPSNELKWFEDKGVDMKFIFQEIILKEFDKEFIKKYNIKYWMEK